MFDLSFEAEIKKVTVLVKSGARLCKLSLEREFDSAVADAIGADAKRALKALQTHGLTEVVIPIDAIAGTLDLAGPSETVVKIAHVTGVKAKCRAGKADNEEDPPKIRLEFVFPWQEQAWAFLGHNCMCLADVEFTPAQTTIPFPAPVAVAPKEKGRKKAAAKEATA